MENVEPVDYSSVEELDAKLNELGACRFQLQDGTSYGVERREDGLVWVYEEIESDEWREESFPSFGQAVSLFLVGGKSLMELSGGVVLPPFTIR